MVQSGPTRVAIIDVDGLILNTPFVGPLSCGENPVALFREKLDAVARDKCVKAVVLRINSPGGGVAACISMRHDLERFKACTKLPVVACLMDTAAGGAYYLASGADQIVAGPATVTGGVGVILNLAVWFGLQVLFAELKPARFLGAAVDLPVLASANLPAMALAAACAVAVFRLKFGMIPVLLAAALAGVVYALVLSA